MKSDLNVIKLVIHDINKIIYDDYVKSVTSINATGQFDILPKHTNFITIISEYIIINDQHGISHKLTITKAVLKCNNNQIDIYISVDKISDIEKNIL